MTKPFSLEALMNLAEHHNQSASRKLGLLNQQQQNAQQKLDTLLEFRRDYQLQMQKGSQEGMNPIELKNFQQFIYKLDDAIAQQRKQLEKSQASTQRGRDEFDLSRRKLKSLDTLRQRHIDTQRRIADKAEQKSQDEHSGRAAARKLIGQEQLANQSKNES